MFRNFTIPFALALTASAGTAFSVEVPRDVPSPVQSVTKEDLENLPSARSPEDLERLLRQIPSKQETPAPPKKSPQEAAREKTMAAAAKARETGTAATDALCGGDRERQRTTGQAAEAALKALGEAAAAEADLDPAVQQARREAEAAARTNDARFRESALKEYQRIRLEKIRRIFETSLEAPANPTPVKEACPPPEAPKQRTAAPSPVPSPPATPAKVGAMLNGLDNEVMKAALAQPLLKGRVESLLGLGGCNWAVNANAAGEATARDAAGFLNQLEDGELFAALSNGGMADRINTIFDRQSCAGYTQQGVSSARLPAANNANRNDGPYVNGSPFGYTGRTPNGVPGQIPYLGNEILNRREAEPHPQDRNEFRDRIESTPGVPESAYIGSGSMVAP